MDSGVNPDHAASARPPGTPIELVPARLYLVGGNVPLDGSASWVPATATGHQAANCYLLTGIEGADEPLIIDPGLPVVEADVVTGLQALIPDGARPRVFVTRAQFDCVGNLGAVAAAFPVSELFTGGSSNPFDSFDTVTSADQRAASVPLLRSPGESRLEVFSPPVRILSTFWGYDATTKALFTSDSFTHAIDRTGDGRRVQRSADVDDVTDDDVRAHILATFWWLEHADTRPISEDLERLFDRLDIEIIAPSRGRVLLGRDVVARHIELFTSVLADIAGERAWV